MTDIIAIVSDLHINSTVGLCPPIVNLDDGGTYKASKAQRWLWECWTDYTAKVKAAAGANPITLIVNGDAVEGDTKKRSNQVITRNKATILSMAAETLKPLVDISTRAFFIRGTAAHVGKSAELEEELAKDCTIAEPCTDAVSSWWSVYAEFGGVCFDIAHHGRLGSMPWSRANPLGVLATRVMLAYAGRRAPDVIVRSHNHKYACTHDNYPLMVVSSPAWQLATEYTNRLGIPEPADIGGLVFTCKDGKYTWEKHLYKAQPERMWTNRTSGKR